MDFSLTDDRRMLSDSLTRYLADTLSMERRNAAAYDAPFHDPEIWAGLSELGLWAAMVSEDKGGFGGAGADIAVVFEALGQALCPEPALGLAIAGAALPEGDPLLEPLMEGAAKVAVACDDSSEVSAEAIGTHWRLTGRQSVVYGGQAAQWILVHAPTGMGQSLFAVEASAAQITGYGMIDGGGAAEVYFDATEARLIQGANCELGRQAALVALCAEAVGVASYLIDATVEYLKTRVQFGQPIGANQVLQHRVVDLTIELEQMRSATILAASSMGTDQGPLHCAMAKNLIGRAGCKISEEAIQLHGGIAMTWEVPVSHYAKRLVMIDHQFGDTDDHLERVIGAL